MVRTQIQLTTTQADQLRRIAAHQRSSVAELIRKSVDSFLQGRSGVVDLKARARSVAGQFGSGSPDGGTEHDRHLADAFSK